MFCPITGASWSGTEGPIRVSQQVKVTTVEAEGREIVSLELLCVHLSHRESQGLGALQFVLQEK